MRGDTAVAAALRPSKDAAPVPRTKPDREGGAAEARAQDRGRAVVVHRRDTLSELAARHNVSAREIIVLNDLKAPYVLVAGERLRLPPSVTYVVREGDTIYGISRRFGIDMASLVRANGIDPPYTITVGQRLNLPGAAVTAAKAPETVVTVDDKPLAAASPARFEWPLKGDVVSTFGPKPGGLHNDGINIAAARGAPVRAAEGGVVAYAGNELRGFGELLLIRHADGWVTAYSHNEALLVGRGEAVSRGQIIGRVIADVFTQGLNFRVYEDGKRAALCGFAIFLEGSGGRHVKHH